MSDLTARFMATDAAEAEAEAKALEACRRYYGETGFTMSVDSTEVRTFAGNVVGYDVTVTAVSDGDEPGREGSTEIHYQRDSTESG